MINHTVEHVICYINSNRDQMLDKWMKGVLVNPSDHFKDAVRLNGSSMLNLVIAFLNSAIDEEKLRALAFKVSEERLKANINIGEFVYNVNIGRSEIFNHLPRIGLSIEELHPIMVQINYCFDKFLYYAVQHYTEVRNQLLIEQSSFIEQTHKDRLTILGQMSASFVHEFRNPLTSVIGFIQLLRSKYPSLEYLDIITKELDQLKFRISQFLLVSRKTVKEKEMETFHLIEVFEETLDFLYPMIVSSDVSIEMTVDDSIYFYGYRDEFRQVIINIIMNSLDALSEHERKTIRINGCTDKNYGIVSISNNGPEIPKDTIDTIFEPFFSTKQLGTGIGLYVCRKIIEEHKGTIDCDSNVDWTTFRMTIPLE